MTGVASRRLGAPPSPVRLIVLEGGADARGVRALGRGDEEMVVIAQGREESPLDLVLRVIHRLSSLEQGRRHVVNAVIRVAPRTDKQTNAARDLLARALLTHSAVAGTTELVFHASTALDPAHRHQLLELVEQLIQESVTGSNAIRVQFGDVRPSIAPESGVMAIARTTPPADASIASARESSTELRFAGVRAARAKA